MANETVNRFKTCETVKQQQPTRSYLITEEFNILKVNYIHNCAVIAEF